MLLVFILASLVRSGGAYQLLGNCTLGNRFLLSPCEKVVLIHRDGTLIFSEYNTVSKLANEYGNLLTLIKNRLPASCNIVYTGHVTSVGDRCHRLTKLVIETVYSIAVLSGHKDKITRANFTTKL